MNVEMKKPCMTMVVSHHQENPGGCFLDITRRRRGKYECKTCGKRFKSFQALGGHQGIHKKVKPTDDENYDECELRLDIYVDPLNKSSFGMHQCKQCLKEFDSGQALGGHMRRHTVEKDLVLMQEINEEDVVRRQQASDEEGKSDLMMETEEVSRLKAEEDDDYSSRRRELILAAREWRLSI